jgi:hypothetical protein
MTDDPSSTEPEAPADGPTLHQQRMQLIWRTLVFQLKLAADGLFDLVLSPVSIGAAILGLVSGGDRPDRYLREVQRVAYRAERWLNLSGHYRSEDSADTLLAPLEARLKGEYTRGGWVTKSANQMNTMLDSLKDPRRARDSTERDAPSSVKDESPPH